MTDDIVTRLRNAHEQSAKYPRLLLSEIEALNEAADEIERLRYEIARWKQLAKNDVKMCDPHDPCEMCKELAAHND
jgi:hypothetical protein